MSTGRKNEHIKYAMETCTFNDIFKDIHILYNSIPELDFNSLDTSIYLFGRRFSYPIIINAITGGSDEAFKINRALSAAAARYDIPMAVGSQTIGVKDKSLSRSFSVVREVNREGFILANVSASVPLSTVKEALEMVEADALQIHLNVLQELIMPEGDRNFKGLLENIRLIMDNIQVPVVVKEVGFGMMPDTVHMLKDAGVQNIDIGGFGGTNFARIESLRRMDKFAQELDTLGIPTPASLYAVCRDKGSLKVICGGGIRNGLHITKAIIMGADAVSLAYLFLEGYKTGGESGVIDYMERLIYELKVSMVASGSGDIPALTKKRVIITGETLEWIKQI